MLRVQVFLQNMGAFVLLLSLVVRLLSAPAHPWWKSYRHWTHCVVSKGGVKGVTFST